MKKPKARQQSAYQRPTEDAITPPSDPHTNVKQLRVDSRTVIFIPREYTAEQAAEFVRRYRELRGKNQRDLTKCL